MHCNIVLKSYWNMAVSFYLQIVRNYNGKLKEYEKN